MSSCFGKTVTSGEKRSMVDRCQYRCASSASNLRLYWRCRAILGLKYNHLGTV